MPPSATALRRSARCERPAHADDRQVIVFRPGLARQLAPQRDVVGTGVQEGLEDVRKLFLELQAPSRREGVGLQEVRDAASRPVRRLERLVHDDLVPLDKDDLVAIPRQRQRRRKACDTGSEDRDLHCRTVVERLTG